MSIPAKLGIPDSEFRLVIGSSQIGYDPDKESKNREKHGYSLESAVHLLERILLPSGSQPPHIFRDASAPRGKVRHNHMSIDDSGNVVFMVTTMRPDETVRIISFRRASEEERKLYHAHR